MKLSLLPLPVVFLLFITSNVSAKVRYVDLNCTNATPPFTDWTIAATNIQDAIDAAEPGDEVVVTNGIYQTGGRVVSPGTLTNRVAITKPLAVRSVNGPAETIIKGYQVPGTINGSNTVRCVYLADGVLLEGFTLTNGATSGGGTSTNGFGGGALCESTNVLLFNCTLIGNAAALSGAGIHSGTASNCVIQENSGVGAARSLLLGCDIRRNTQSGTFLSTAVGSTIEENQSFWGGGAWGGTLINCILAGNEAENGGGAMSATLINCALYANRAYFRGGAVEFCTLTNCTVIGNSALDTGGGSYRGTLNNTIIFYNTAPFGPDYSGSTLWTCWTTDPQLASLSHLSSASPCRNAGDPAVAAGHDIDGEDRGTPPSIGCDEYVSGSVTGAIDVVVNVTSATVATGAEVRFTGLISGRLSASRWEFGDGIIVSNRPIIRYKWTVPRNYPVVLRAFNESFPEGVSSTSVVQVIAPPVHYVRWGNFAQAFPYTNWATAAKTIQSALDAASVPGSVVVVSNGLYDAGEKSHLGLVNQLVVTNQTIVRSLNGPASTSIRANNWSINSYVRCVYLGDGSMLDGFTVTNGRTGMPSGGSSLVGYSGAGVFCESPASVVTNCIIIGNDGGRGGGVFGGTICNSLITSNTGGGIAYALANRCTVSKNSGGGAFGGILNSCLIISNVLAAGTSSAAANNCTIAGNSGTVVGGVVVSGAVDSQLTNCIIYYNSGQNFGASQGPTAPPLKLTYCCTTPSPLYLYSGGGNFTNPPLFVVANRNLRPQTNSPCINAGTNACVPPGPDLDGRPRIAGGTVDVGAYEFQGVKMSEFIGWLQQNNLPTDGSADYSDTDVDGLNNWQEWIAGTLPTNAFSVLKMLSPSSCMAGWDISWQSVSGKNYFLERGTNLIAQPPFVALQSNIVGQAGTTTFTDTTATNGGPYLYRVGVQ